MVAGAEIPGNITNELLSAKKYGTERAEEFMKKKLLFREVSFYYLIERSNIVTSLNKKIRES